MLQGMTYSACHLNVQKDVRMQVEAEVKPFKGILLGLFFLCTGAAVDVPILLNNAPTVVLLTVGLISVKFTITSVAARAIGLTEAESVKVGLTLSQVRCPTPDCGYSSCRHQCSPHKTCR